MERDIRKAYKKYHCKECENKDNNVCNITVNAALGVVIAKCPYYKSSKRQKRSFWI